MHKAGKGTTNFKHGSVLMLFPFLEYISSSYVTDKLKEGYLLEHLQRSYYCRRYYSKNA